MASSDPHQGGDLFDMAAKGTSIPGDAGVMNIIPSKPRPGEGLPTNAAESTLAAAAENPSDIPRSVQDIGATGEVVTGTGDQLNANVEAKRLHYGPNDPAFKGHDRNEKHGKDMESAIESRASGSLGVDLTPAEEDRLNKTGATDEDLDKIVQARETKQV
ncbi:Nop domain-containing protein [Rutstroemia sp. NJR-2017a BBW]|nr:Nop domain-containing protein [Rutstroemia sp. NJR-2017a BBW]